MKSLLEIGRQLSRIYDEVRLRTERSTPPEEIRRQYKRVDTANRLYDLYRSNIARVYKKPYYDLEGEEVTTKIPREVYARPRRNVVLVSKPKAYE